ILYYRARQAGGERLRETSDQEVELRDLPRYSGSPAKQAIALLIVLLAIFMGWIGIKNYLFSVAAKRGNIIALKVLLATGVDADTRINDQDLEDNSKTTALFIAARNGWTDIVKLLLDNRADVNGRNAGDTEGSPSLLFAAGFCHTDTVKVLLA